MAAVVPAVLTISGAAMAETPAPTWGGFYLGADVAARIEQDVGRNGVLAPHLYSGFAYPTLPPAVAPAGQSGVGAVPAGGIWGGYLVDQGPYVFGLEGQVDFGRATVLSTTTASYDGGTLNACGSGSLGCLEGPSTDALRASTSVGVEGSLRARVGVPIGDRLLLSGFAGPAVAAVKLRAVQTSTSNSLFISFTGAHFFENEVPLSATAASQRAEVLAGGTVGAALDYRLDPHWVLRGEYALTVLPSIQVRLDQGGGAVTIASSEPLLHAIRLGLAYAF